jgi:hypothetical protein
MQGAERGGRLCILRACNDNAFVHDPVFQFITVFAKNAISPVINKE